MRAPRGARLRAEVAGFGCSSDASHLVAPDASGAGPVRAMRWAMADAGITPEEIDYINAHGTSTPLNDVSRDAGHQDRAGGGRGAPCPSAPASP